MSYQDELFQFAKFRHVLFHVSGAETMVGRRTVVHEFPMRDFPYPEDMGKKAAEFVVDGFLIGDDYLWQMADLISALNEPGPGTLVHPSLGTLQVSLAQPGKLRESFIERRGMVTFSLTFVESIDITQPSLSVDSQQAVEDAADDAYAPVEDDFASEFDTDNAPAWEKTSLVDEINNINAVVGNVRDAIRFNLSPLSALIKAGAQLKANVMGLIATPNALFTELSVQIRALVNLFDFSAAQGIVQDTKTSARSLSNVTQRSTPKSRVAASQTKTTEKPFGSATTPSNPLRELLTLTNYGKEKLPGEKTVAVGSYKVVSPGGTSFMSGFSGGYVRQTSSLATPVRLQQSANIAALVHLVRRVAVIEAVRASIYIPFNNVEESVKVRTVLFDALDAVMLDAPDSVYTAMAALRSAMVRDITQRGANLAKLSTTVLNASTPAQVMAYRLYESGGLAPDIVNRNQLPASVMHPLFVPGGRSLEVRRA